MTRRLVGLSALVAFSAGAQVRPAGRAAGRAIDSTPAVIRSVTGTWLLDQRQLQTGERIYVGKIRVRYVGKATGPEDSLQVRFIDGTLRWKRCPRAGCDAVMTIDPPASLTVWQLAREGETATASAPLFLGSRGDAQTESESIAIVRGGLLVELPSSGSRAADDSRTQLALFCVAQEQEALPRCTEPSSVARCEWRRAGCRLSTQLAPGWYCVDLYDRVSRNGTTLLVLGRGRTRLVRIMAAADAPRLQRRLDSLTTAMTKWDPAANTVERSAFRQLLLFDRLRRRAAP